LDQRPGQSRSFGTAAKLYDRHRPTYAADAVAWALGPSPVRVADLGAGTGILTRVVLAAGHAVVAVEPDEQMRAQLTESTPGVPALAGSAERIPLPDASVDAVVAGQAYHWFDPEPAHAEIARVLRPGGVFAAMWNDADNDVPWTVEYCEIIDGPADPDERDWDFGPLFEPVQVAEFRHAMWLTPDELMAMARTRSPYLVGTPAQRQRITDGIARLLAEPPLAGRERFPMPHITRVHRAALRPRS
jgi:SAM-dependent methyltransferase